MRLVTFLSSGSERLGALVDDTVVDLNLDDDLLALLQKGEPGLAAARDALAAAPVEARRPRADVTLLPPLPRPPKIICVARNYAEHAKEAGLQVSEIPILFARFAKTLVGDGGNILRPTVSEQLDWEGELAVVIGKPGRHISKADAMDHVAGYSIFNDVTVRDYQFRVTQYTGGKNFSASGPFGPALVTKDEVPDPHNVDVSTELNGERVQHANTSDMIFDIPTIIEHISEFIDLEAGDVIPMGTPSGVGFKREPPWFLKPGDEVKVTVTGLGTLTNPVVAEEDLGS